MSGVAHVRFDQTSKSFGATQAVAPLDLTVVQGEFTVLIGPSGCGKTTSLRMLAGFEPPTSGRILLGDRDITNMAPKDRTMAMVFQNYALYPHMTAAQNMGFALRLRGVPAAEIETRVRSVAAMLGLEPLLQRRPRELSGGQRQRVAVGRAIVRDPEVFLFDEPLSNLDAQLRSVARSEIRALQRSLGVTTVYVTHDQVEAMTMADRIAVMNHGVLLQYAPPMEVYEQPADTFVASFLGSPAMNIAPAAQLLAFATLTDELREALGSAHSLGIRPEHLAVANAAGKGAPASGTALRFPATLQRLENLGAETLVYARTVPGDLLISRVGGALKACTGAIEFTADARHVVAFGEDGRRIATRFSRGGTQ